MTPTGLVEARAALGLSQDQLGAEVGASGRTIRKLEKGEGQAAGGIIPPWLEGKVRRLVLDRAPARLAYLGEAVQGLEVALVSLEYGGALLAFGHARRALAAASLTTAGVAGALKAAEKAEKGASPPARIPFWSLRLRKALGPG